ncbi:MAG: hydrogenase expression/formation protein [gamma proteobacterium symbiont of Phacoides pectinatus]
MERLDNIPVVSASSPGSAVGVTGNVLPLLHEIRHALERLAHDRESTVIDLRAIPLAPGDEERLLSLLGRGEVSLVLSALGRSEIRESGYPGVWVVEHYNDAGERIALQIEVTDIPAIARSQVADIEESSTRLNDLLMNDNG